MFIFSSVCKVNAHLHACLVLFFQSLLETSEMYSVRTIIEQNKGSLFASMPKNLKKANYFSKEPWNRRSILDDARSLKYHSGRKLYAHKHIIIPLAVAPTPSWEPPAQSPARYIFALEPGSLPRPPIRTLQLGSSPGSPRPAPAWAAPLRPGTAPPTLHVLLHRQPLPLSVRSPVGLHCFGRCNSGGRRLRDAQYPPPAPKGEPVRSQDGEAGKDKSK